VIGGAVTLVAAIGSVVVWQLAARDVPAPAPDAAPQVAAVAPDAAAPVALAPADAPPLVATPPVRRTDPGPGSAELAVTRPQVPITAPPTTRRTKPLSRIIAEQMFDAFCRLPVDPAKPDPAIADHRVIDWGKVTRAEVVQGVWDERPRAMAMYEVKGARGTYRFDGAADLENLGLLDVPPGTIVALCVGDQGNNVYEVPASWRGYATMTSYLPISRPPRITELEKLAPIHVSDGSLTNDATFERISLPAGRRGLVRLRLRDAPDQGARWQIANWWLEVPAGIPGHALMQAKQTRWIVVEEPRLEPQPDGSKRLVLRAAAVVDDMFPP